MIICRSDCIYICSSKWEVRSRIPIWLKKCCVVSSAVKQERKEDFCEFLSHQYHQETWVSRIKQCLNAWKQSTPGTWSKIWHLKKKEEGKRWRLLELREGTSLSLSLSSPLLTNQRLHRCAQLSLSPSVVELPTSRQCSIKGKVTRTLSKNVHNTWSFLLHFLQKRDK